MKYCEKFAALLDPYVDGELSGEEAARVRAHLECCPGCRRYVDGALAIRAAFPDVEETAVPEGFAAGVMAELRELEAAKEKRTPSGTRRHARWRAVLLPLAACFALVVLVRTVPRGGENQTAVSTVSMAPPAAADTAAPAGSASQYSLDAAPRMAEAQIENDSVTAEEAVDVPNPESLSPAPASAPADTPAAADSAPSEVEEVAPAAVPTSGGKMSRMTALRAIRLTAEEAGELLMDLPYTTEEDGTRCYQLPNSDFDALLEALAERDILPLEAEVPETEILPEGYDLVYVTEE